MENRFFTILLLPSNSSRVKELILSRSLIKSLVISALAIIFVSTGIFFDYVNIKKREVDLTSLKEKAKVQNVQLQTFADKISDLEAELARLRSLDTKLKVLTNSEESGFSIKPKNERMANEKVSLGGRGGPEFMPVSFEQKSLLKDMMVKLDRLNIEATAQEGRFHEIHASIEDEKSFIYATPSNWPVRGYISSGFGSRVSPFNGSNEFHDGVDISAPTGTPVTASADGVVTLAGSFYDLGNAITIEHGYGFISRYGHLSKVMVHPGQTVKIGQKIGVVGSTGRSTGPHLHYEVAINGSKVDPVKYLN